MNKIAKRFSLVFLLFLVFAGQASAFSFDWLNQVKNYVSQSTVLCVAGFVGLTVLAYYMRAKDLTRSSGAGSSENDAIPIKTLESVISASHSQVMSPVQQRLWENAKAVVRTNTSDKENYVLENNTIYEYFNKTWGRLLDSTKPYIFCMAPDEDKRHIIALECSKLEIFEKENKPQFKERSLKNIWILNLLTKEHKQYPINETIAQAFPDSKSYSYMDIACSDSRVALVDLKKLMVFDLNDPQLNHSISIHDLEMIENVAKPEKANVCQSIAVVFEDGGKKLELGYRYTSPESGESSVIRRFDIIENSQDKSFVLNEQILKQ